MRHSGATGAVVLASREKLDAAAPYVVVPPAELGMRVVEAGLPGELTSPHHRLGLAGVIACPPVSWVPKSGLRSSRDELGWLHSRLAVAIVTRLVPQQRAPQPCLAQPLDLPLVTDAASYAEAMRRILAAVTAGRLPPLEGERLSRLARAAWQATAAEVRARHRLR